MIWFSIPNRRIKALYVGLGILVNNALLPVKKSMCDNAFFSVHTNQQCIFTKSLFCYCYICLLMMIILSLLSFCSPHAFLCALCSDLLTWFVQTKVQDCAGSTWDTDRYIWLIQFLIHIYKQGLTSSITYSAPRFRIHIFLSIFARE